MPLPDCLIEMFFYYCVVHKSDPNTSHCKPIYQQPNSLWCWHCLCSETKLVSPEITFKFAISSRLVHTSSFSVIEVVDFILRIKLPSSLGLQQQKQRSGKHWISCSTFKSAEKHFLVSLTHAVSFMLMVLAFVCYCSHLVFTYLVSVANEETHTDKSHFMPWSQRGLICEDSSFSEKKILLLTQVESNQANIYGFDLKAREREREKIQGDEKLITPFLSENPWKCFHFVLSSMLKKTFNELNLR